jgi:DNA invertase Pin-like site-specific DNA recombinase
MVADKQTIFAAQYLRMSTDMQEASLDNQAAAIEAYATERGMRVVRSYVDAGVSGLLERRDGLQALIRDVEAREIDFSVVLVYDVSRWGRFQDIDAAAHYEYVCRKAGVSVVYCMDRFENDGTPLSSIVKSLKRIMAAEYSRDLGERVYAGQCRRARKGFKGGGSAPYAYRRVEVGKDGQPIRMLTAGQGRSRGPGGVKLALGPRAEVDAVRRIFALRLERRISPSLIATALNRERIAYRDGEAWDLQRVRAVLKNPIYCGTLVWGRTSKRLHTKPTDNPPEKWIVTPGAAPAIVTADEFRAASELTPTGDGEFGETVALERLRELYEAHGYLSKDLVDSTPGHPRSDYYAAHFDGLRNAFLRVGFTAGDRLRGLGIHEIRRFYRGMVETTLTGVFKQRGFQVRRGNHSLTVNGEVLVRYAVLSRLTNKRGDDYWCAQLAKIERNSIIVFARLEPGNQFIMDYWVARARLIRWRAKRLYRENAGGSGFRVFATLEQLPDFIWG